MNIKKIILIFSFASAISTTIFPIGEKQRDFLNTIQLLEQDFAEVPAIRDNIDHFVELTKAHQLILQKKLKIAKKTIKPILLKTTITEALATALISFGSAATGNLFVIYRENSKYGYLTFSDRFFAGIPLASTNLIFALTTYFSARTLYNEWKKYITIKKELESNTQTLAKLLELQITLHSELAPEEIINDSQ